MIDMAMPTVGVFPLTCFHRAVQTTIKEGIVLPRDKAIPPQGRWGGAGSHRTTFTSARKIVISLDSLVGFLSYPTGLCRLLLVQVLDPAPREQVPQRLTGRIPGEIGQWNSTSLG